MINILLAAPTSRVEEYVGLLSCVSRLLSVVFFCVVYVFAIFWEISKEIYVQYIAIRWEAKFEIKLGK